MKISNLCSMTLCLMLPCCLVACDSGGSSGADSSAKPSATTATSAPKKEAEKPAPKKAAAKADGPFGPFGKFITEAADAAITAAKGEKADAKWNIESLDGSDAARFKGAEIVFITAEIEAISPQHGYIRTNVYVFPDGLVRFVKMEHRPGKPFVKPTEGVDKAAPVLAATTKTLIDTLTGESCSLPLMGAGDAERLPGKPQASQLPDLKPMQDKLCAAVKGKPEGWVPRYDDFTVMMVNKATNTGLSVRSGIRVEDGKLKLGKPRVK